jgi:hypothetical protein
MSSFAPAAAAGRERGMSGSYYSLEEEGQDPAVPLQPSPSFALACAAGNVHSSNSLHGGVLGRVHSQSVDDDSFGTPLSDESLRLHGVAGASAVWPARLSRDDVIASARRFQRLKPISNSRLRWNLLWLLVIWAVFLFPLYAPYLLGCRAAFYAIAATLTFFNVVWLFAIGFTAYYVRFLYKNMNKDYKLLYPADARCFHIIILTVRLSESNKAAEEVQMQVR